METGLLNLKYGVAGICVMLCLLFLLQLLQIFMKTTVKRSELSEDALKKLTVMAQELTFEMKSLDKRLVLTEGTLSKLDLDYRRFYSALKLTAGERWPEISDAVQKELRL